MSTQTEPGQRGDRVVHRYERYAMQPVQLLRNPKSSSHATRVFGLLDSYSDWDTQTAFPAHARLAGVGMPTVRRAIKELVDTGYVSVQPAYDARGMRIGTIYTLFDAAQPSSGPGNGNGESGVITGDHITRRFRIRPKSESSRSGRNEVLERFTKTFKELLVDGASLLQKYVHDDAERSGQTFPVQVSDERARERCPNLGREVVHPPRLNGGEDTPKAGHARVWFRAPLIMYSAC